MKLRYYRRVTAFLIFDQIHGIAGYYCAACRRKQFAKYMGLTLVFGWWGTFAMAFRNPFAIVSNFWALFSPPMAAHQFGAINVDAIRGRESAQNQMRDAYMSLPTWFRDLSNHDLELL